MPERTKPSASQSKGLTEIVRQQLEAILVELVSFWQLEPLADLRRVVRPTGINIERYRGAEAWSNLRKKLDGRQSLNLLDEAIRANQPALLGRVSYPNAFFGIQNVPQLTLSLCGAALRYMNTHLSTEDAIKRVLTELDQILVTSRATQEILTLFSGLTLPKGIDPIALEENVSLRRLTADEITELGSNDVGDMHNIISSLYVTTALAITNEVPLILSEQCVAPPNIIFNNKPRDQLATFLSALYIFKTGGVGVVTNLITLRPTILPGMSVLSYRPSVVNHNKYMELTHDEIEKFVTLYKKIISNRLFAGCCHWT